MGTYSKALGSEIGKYMKFNGGKKVGNLKIVEVDHTSEFSKSLHLAATRKKPV